MKILGQTETGYLVDINEDEIAKVSGFGSTYGDDWKKHLKSINAIDHHGRLRVGAIFPVADYWRRLEAIRSNSADLAKMGKTLRGLADLVDGAWPAARIEIKTLTGDE